jgi:hypothetical protein
VPRPTRPTPTNRPAALRLLPTPSWDPPYDDRPATGSPRPGPRRVPPDAEQRALALTFVLPAELPAVPTPPRLRLVPPDDDEEERAPVALPDPRGWAGRLAVATVEVLAGTRPLPQLRRWTSDDVYAQLRRRSARGRVTDSARDRARGSVDAHSPTRVRTVRVCEPTQGVAEVTVVVDDGRRARALAMRLESGEGRWRCTELVAW